VSWKIFVVFALAYFFTAKGLVEAVDTGASIDTAEAIVMHGDFAIAPLPYLTMTGRGGRDYSKYGLGVVLTFLPVVPLAHLAAHVAHQPEPYVAAFFISFLNVGFGLLLLGVFGRVLRRFETPEPTIVLLTIALGLGTLCWRYAITDFTEELQATLLLLTLDGTMSRTRGGLVRAGGALGFLLLIKASHVIFAPLFALYVIACAEGAFRRRIVDVSLFAAPVVCGFTIILFYNFARFGTPFETGYGAEAHDFSIARVPTTLPALLLSADKGVFVFCPVLVLGLVGLRAFFRERRAEALLVSGVFLANLFFLSTFVSWVGGQCWGPRYLVPTIPFCLLPAAFWLGRNQSRRRFAIAAVLTAISFVVQVPGAFVRESEVHYLRLTLMNADEAAQIGDLRAALVLFSHKLHRSDEIYSASELGISGDRTFDMTSHRTLNGLSPWTSQLAREFRKPAIGWFGLLGWLVTLGLLVRASFGLGRVVREWPRPARR
jgi:hypothetical protein